MDGAESTPFSGKIEDASQDALPFRLGDVEIKPWFIDFHPMVPQIRNELVFQLRLFRLDWNTQYSVAVVSAIFAVFLGALNGDIFDGGNAKISGFFLKML